ncbi:cytochrome C [Pseudomonas sp. Choline-3u-10]|jgi:cytochrome c556|uniref:c-type cytochrome n=1 Tax=Pseudomonadaceae TaxID=135621 RepID=UPI000617DD09|nr:MULTISPECIES: cytochrome c [Pseudomonadaceae]AZZ47021.1 cytochrome C [Pseudomonadaceae bacterium SI-3]MAL37825.1 cytochrome C [Pseudomonas sp.]MBU0950517.1 cytochrome c [Gammaproteobacteria bacterium]KJJ64640.1 cytochrome C [Pseudomonas sp. 10B238]MBK3793840.1 cytochrome c [Stutzerimonas stutzeri]|tara:strand:+ start:766 stop:1215 length:450 start_codon:yes stop_codon:yes gene_type:complete
MKLLPLSVSLVAVLALLAGCDRIDPNSPLGKRKAIYQQMLDVKEDLGGMLRGRLPFDPEGFTSGAAKLDQLSRQPWQHYPEVKEAQSDARDDVWQQQARFNQMARELEARTAALVAATTQTPVTSESVAPAFQQVEDACEACHKEFRAY